MLDWISANRSITKMYFLVQGNLSGKMKVRQEDEEEFKSYLKEHNMNLFSRVIITKEYGSTIRDIMQSETIGNLPLNTVLLDYNDKLNLNKLVPEAIHLKKNVIILRNQGGFSNYRTIDVWWENADTGNFMLLLAYLITHSKKWQEEEAIIRVFKMVEHKSKIEETRESMNKIILESRIENIELRVIVGTDKKLRNIIFENSKNSDMVFLGIPKFKDKRTGQKIIQNINLYTSRLKSSLIVLATDRIDLRVS